MTDWEPIALGPSDREEGIRQLQAAPVIKAYLASPHWGHSDAVSVILQKKPGGGLDSLRVLFAPVPEWVGAPWHAVNHDLRKSGVFPRYSRVLQGLHLRLTEMPSLNSASITASAATAQASCDGSPSFSNATTGSSS